MRFPSLTGILAGMLLATAPGAFGASITYAGVDTATKSNWRSTSVTKPQDLSGDNAYGTDGYIAGVAQTAVLNPSYATLAIIGGTQDPAGFIGENLRYDLESTTELIPVNWQPVAGITNVLGDGSPKIFTNPPSAAPAKFFRLKLRLE